MRNGRQKIRPLWGLFKRFVLYHAGILVVRSELDSDNINRKYIYEMDVEELPGPTFRLYNRFRDYTEE